MSWIQSDFQYTPPEPLEIVTWSSGTDEQIAAMLNAHYNDEIDITDYWAVGDTRLIHLNSMAAPTVNGSGNGTISEQDIIVVIVAMNHTDLETPINGHTKAAITVQTREILGTYNAYDRKNAIYINGDNSADYSFTKWSNLYMRNYLNDKVLGAIPDGSFKSAIKSSKHYKHNDYNGTGTEQVIDTIFLPSYPEIFGTASAYNSYYGAYMYVATSPTEGTQFSYYESSSNRIKYGNNNGQSDGNAVIWWTGSPCSYYNSSGYSWMGVASDGVWNFPGGSTCQYLSPAWAM